MDPRVDAKVDEGKLHSGKLLMSIHTGDAEELLKRMGAEHIRGLSEASAAPV